MERRSIQLERRLDSLRPRPGGPTSVTVTKRSGLRGHPIAASTPFRDPISPSPRLGRSHILESCCAPVDHVRISVHSGAGTPRWRLGWSPDPSWMHSAEHSPSDQTSESLHGLRSCAKTEPIPAVAPARRQTRQRLSARAPRRGSGSDVPWLALPGDVANAAEVEIGDRPAIPMWGRCRS